MTPMSEQEVYITNKRYMNQYVIWGRPKGILYGNIPGSGNEQKANLYPDLAAIHNTASICLPKGGALTLMGQYPHARYISFTIANQLGGGQIGNGRYIRGDQIIPDMGSNNPFLWTNSRDVIERNFTLYIVQGNSPNSPSNNTLYTGSFSGDRIHLTIRTYLADQLYDGTGNVRLNETGYGLPKVILNLPGGKNITGPQLLEELRAQKNGDPNGYTLKQWLWEIENSDDKINAPALRKPVSQVFWNTNYSTTGAFYAKNPEERVRNYPANNTGGFANNPDTRYMLMMFSFDFGEVLVVRAKMPTHPKTRRGGNVLPTDPQVQYFSVSTAAAPPYGAGWDTVFDEEFDEENMLDEYGKFTIVVSWPWNRPTNATRENGIIWINPGDGEGHYVGARNWVGLLYIRYQNPSPNWSNSPKNIPMPTIKDPIPQDQFVMGPYYPMGEYMSKNDFDNQHIKNSKH